MDLHIKKISEQEYMDLFYYVLFENELTDRSYGIINYGEYWYKLGWQSDKIDPYVLEINEDVFLIGIDQNLVIFDFSNRHMVFKTSLDYFFYEAKVDKGQIYAITELEILKIEISSFKIVTTYELPDYFDKIEFYDNYLKIICAGDQILNIPQ